MTQVDKDIFLSHPICLVIKHFSGNVDLATQQGLTLGAFFFWLQESIRQLEKDKEDLREELKKAKAKKEDTETKLGEVIKTQNQLLKLEVEKTCLAREEAKDAHSKGYARAHFEMLNRYAVGDHYKWNPTVEIHMLQ